MSLAIRLGGGAERKAIDEHLRNHWNPRVRVGRGKLDHLAGGDLKVADGERVAICVGGTGQELRQSNEDRLADKDVVEVDGAVDRWGAVLAGAAVVVAVIAVAGIVVVVAIDAAANTVIAGPRAALAVAAARLTDINLLGPTTGDIAVKVRSLAPLAAAGWAGDRVEFASPQFGVSPGQAAVAYAGSRLVGGGTIAVAEPAEAVDAPREDGAQVEPATHYVVKKKVFDLFSNHWIEGLRQEGAFRGKECVVFGVATDYCVRACVLGLVDAGARVRVVTDAIRGVAPDSTLQTLTDWESAGVELTTSNAILTEISSAEK
jgi:nicotinamidase-related amidase